MILEPESREPPRPGSGWRLTTSFSLGEMVVAAVIVFALMAMLLRALDRLQEQAEKTAMESVVTQLNAGLRHEAAARLARGADGEVAGLAVENPFRWLGYDHPQYLGEADETAPAMEAPPKWYYHLERREVVYLVGRHDHFRSAVEGRREIRFRVVVGQPRSLELRLEPTQAFAWF